MGDLTAHDLPASIEVTSGVRVTQFSSRQG